MLIGFVASGLLGILVGMRFRVFALVPLTLLLSCLSFWIARVLGIEAPVTIEIVSATIMALQLGYLCGSFGASLKDHRVQETEEAFSATSRPAALE